MASVCIRNVWRLLLAVVILGIPVGQSSVAAQSAGEFDVQIQVVPGPTPEDAVQWPGVPRPDTPPATVGTVSALFSQVSLDTHASRPDTVAFDLVVLDERPNAPGWVIAIAQEPDAAHDAIPVLSRFLRRTQAIDTQPVQPDQMPHGTRFSVGQPLDRTTPVIKAEPGTGMGAYWIRFAISGNPDLTAASLIITLTTAP